MVAASSVMRKARTVAEGRLMRASLRDFAERAEECLEQMASGLKRIVQQTFQKKLP